MLGRLIDAVADRLYGRDANEMEQSIYWTIDRHLGADAVREYLLHHRNVRFRVFHPEDIAATIDLTLTPFFEWL